MTNRQLGVMCLCAFLVLTGIFSLTNLQMELAPVILGLLAILAGIFIFVGR